MPVVIGGDNLPSPVGIGLTGLPTIGGAVAPLAPPVPASLLWISSQLNVKKLSQQKVAMHIFKSTQPRS